MILDLDALRESDPSLYAAVSITLGPVTGQQQVALADFPLPTRRRLSDWWESQRAASTENATPASDFTVPPRDLDAELRADIQRTVDQQHGLARLEQFCVEQGLARTPENAEKVQLWLDKNLKGYWSQKGVDVAVLNLAKELTWTPKEVPPVPPPPPAEPTEVLEPWQLPLDANEYQMKEASVKALLDLNLRRRRATNQMYVGKNQRGFGTTL